MSRHPVFKNEHNPGQKTTGHRDVEKARQIANQVGEHPSKGSFRYDWEESPSSYKTGGPNIDTWKTASGAMVKCTDHNPHCSEDESKLTVEGSDGFKHTGSRQAAHGLLRSRYGVDR